MAQEKSYRVMMRIRGNKAKVGSIITMAYDDASLPAFLKGGVLVEDEAQPDAPVEPPSKDEALGEALQALVSEGQTVDALKAMSVANLVKLTGITAKRAAFDDALDLIVAEQHDTAIIGRIGETILTLGDDAKGQDGTVNPDAVRAVQESGETPWTDEQIAAAAVALSMTAGAE